MRQKLRPKARDKLKKDEKGALGMSSYVKTNARDGETAEFVSPYFISAADCLCGKAGDTPPPHGGSRSAKGKADCFSGKPKEGQLTSPK